MYLPVMWTFHLLLDLSPSLPPHVAGELNQNTGELCVLKLIPHNPVHAHVHVH